MINKNSYNIHELLEQKAKGDVLVFLIAALVNNQGGEVEVDLDLLEDTGTFKELVLEKCEGDEDENPGIKIKLKGYDELDRN